MLRTLLTLPLFALLVLAGTTAGQEPKKDEPIAKEVKLRWFGQSFFQLETARRFKIVFDPHAIPNFGRPLVTGDMVLITHPHNDHDQVAALDPKPKDADVYRGVVETKPGKQEWKAIDEKRGPIHFRNVGTFHDAVSGMQRGKNSIWIVEVDGLTFCHMGDLGHELSADQVKAIGKVDVLMIPVGGIYTINGEQAKKTIEQIKPRLYIIPMHYAVPGYDDLIGPDEFLEGQKHVQKMTNTNELVIPLDMKANAPTTVLLGWKKEKKEEEPKKKP
jgi:L-ascorbate metabolism protein UlaG (beta-lactamase superfamily)